MITCVDKVLKPYFFVNEPKDIIPLLILDSYWFHMMGDGISTFQDPRAWDQGEAHLQQMYLPLPFDR